MSEWAQGAVVMTSSEPCHTTAFFDSDMQLPKHRHSILPKKTPFNSGKIIFFSAEILSLLFLTVVLQGRSVIRAESFYLKMLLSPPKISWILYNFSEKWVKIFGFAFLKGCRRCYHTHKAMCYVQWNNFWPTKIFWLSFLLKNRENFLAQGVLKQFFASLWLCCWLQTPLLAQFDMHSICLKTH